MRTILKRISPYLCPGIRGLYFANILKNRNDHFEVTHVEYRQSQFNVTEVPIACLQDFPASVAVSTLPRYTHLRIEGSIVGWGSSSRYIVEVSVTYFDDALFYDVLSRAVDISG